jgi:hypothetical protein
MPRIHWVARQNKLETPKEKTRSSNEKSRNAMGEGYIVSLERVDEEKKEKRKKEEKFQLVVGNQSHTAK